MQPSLDFELPQERDLHESLSENFLSFAVATIRDRALPDVRDGLKPVQRRILYAMHQLRLRPGQPFKKCARIVGDVIGKYHPHGDQAAYDALVRLAQPFAVRYPLVEGQGNFGNIDGDNAAAMRYTEARLTEVAAMLLEGLDEDAVDFRPNFTEEEDEPTVLPATFPALLANGAVGIAVGMATSIPPHNAIELCNALLHLIRAPNATPAKLAELVPGPDFPTGGVLVEPAESILEAYKEGRGSFRLRARWEKEAAGRGAYRVVVSEIPYQVEKSRLVERLAELVTGRKIPLLADIRDESDEQVRIVLEPRSRQVDAGVLMEALFRQTDLEVRIPLNLNVLIDGRTPSVLPLREAMRAFLHHRREVLLRRSRHRLAKIDRRVEILEGYLTVFLNLDRVIEIIRSEDHPKEMMIAEFALTDVQAEAVLNMRLRNLRRLEEIALQDERKLLLDERGEIEQLLTSEERQWGAISTQVRELRKALEGAGGSARRTAVAEAPASEPVPIEAMVEREPITVICSRLGSIRAMRGHLGEDAEIRYREGDEEKFRFHAETTDKLLAFCTNGRFYTLACDRLPGGRGMGEPVRLMIDLPNDEEVVSLFPYREGRRCLLAASDGRGLVTPIDEQVTSPGRKGGKQTLNVKAPARAVACTPIEGGDMAACVGDNQRLLIFDLEDIPIQTRGRGVILQRIKDGELSDVTVFNSAKGLTWKDPAKRTQTLRSLEGWVGRRASAGRKIPKRFPKTLRFS